MDADTAAQINSVSKLILQFGLPAVLEMVTELGKNPHPTVADIEALGDIMKPGESYFEDKPGTPQSPELPDSEA